MCQFCETVEAANKFYEAVATRQKGEAAQKAIMSAFFYGIDAFCSAETRYEVCEVSLTMADQILKHGWAYAYRDYRLSGKPMNGEKVH